MSTVDAEVGIDRPATSETHSIELHGLVKTYGKARALDKVDLRIPKGSFTAILGPSGSGKTTLLNALGGFTDLDEGRVLVNGVDVSRVPANRRNLGYVFQQYALFPHMTIAENVAFPLVSRGVSKAEARERTRDALALVELSDAGKRYASELSGGQQQRIALARALVYEPPVVLLDEPLAALDRRLRESLREELQRIHERVGSTFLLVTHDQEEAMSMADHVVVMRNGKVEQQGTPADVYDNPVTDFVANFLGECNLIEGAVGAAGGPLVHANGIVLAECGDGTVSDRGRAVIRPEMVRLVNDDLGSTETSLRAEVVTQQFVGREVLIRCTSSVGNIMVRVPRTRLNAHAEDATRPGETVTLAWSPHCVRAIPSEGL